MPTRFRVLLTRAMGDTGMCWRFLACVDVCWAGADGAGGCVKCAGRVRAVLACVGNVLTCADVVPTCADARFPDMTLHHLEAILNIRDDFKPVIMMTPRPAHTIAVSAP